MNWKTKPTDRFILKFIKVHISAPLSEYLVRIRPDIRPATLTFAAAFLGICGGISFGLGSAWLGGLMAALAQILDGMDGQVARLSGRSSSEGALLDSFLDRYMDFALLFGILIHSLRYSAGVGGGEGIVNWSWVVLVAGLAAAGSSQVSYTTARAASLKLDFSRPEHAGKGSRTFVIIICGLLTPFWIHFPLVALIYLAIHPNLAVILSMVKLKAR
jgi:phosphatidylglycerophosphate synthase